MLNRGCWDIFTWSWCLSSMPGGMKPKWLNLMRINVAWWSSRVEQCWCSSLGTDSLAGNRRFALQHFGFRKGLLKNGCHMMSPTNMGMWPGKKYVDPTWSNMFWRFGSLKYFEIVLYISLVYFQSHLDMVGIYWDGFQTSSLGTNNQNNRWNAAWSLHNYAWILELLWQLLPQDTLSMRFWNFWDMTCFLRVPCGFVQFHHPFFFMSLCFFVQFHRPITYLSSYISIRSEYIWTTFQHSYHSWDHQVALKNQFTHPSQVHGLKGGKEWNEQNGKVGGRSWGFFEK